MVVRDPSLPHQIVLLGTDGLRYPKGRINVSCNCRARKRSNGAITHDAIAVMRPERGAERMLSAYHDPAAHRGPVPFVSERVSSR